ncbi:MAG: phosphatase PAP2 family protein [Sulfuriferula sp.]
MNIQLTVVSAITAWDDQILHWGNQFMFKWPLFDGAVAWLLNANILKFFPMLLVVCWLWFEKTNKQMLTRQILVESMLATFVALSVGRILALGLPFRDRPIVRPELHFVTPLDISVRNWSSFPSDHAVMAFALAASLFRISPKVGLWALFHATVFICLPRLYFGLHHPSDLIGGALIGIALVLAISHLHGRHVVTVFFLSIERKYPGMFYAIGFFILYEMAEMFITFRILANYIFHYLKQLLT